MAYIGDKDPVLGPRTQTGFTMRTTGSSWNVGPLPDNAGYVDMYMSQDTQIICDNTGSTLALAQSACIYRADTAPHRIVVLGNKYLHYKQAGTGGSMRGTVFSG